ncbi:Uncharacterized protein MLTONO_0939 [Mesorhizobium loti]|nr:Uncharacterized protein MLTONO_0939 [Mesorhizobium loti]
MTETAGSVTIQITANTTAFEAALARAKERATAFDAQISAQLNGAGVSEGLAKISAGVEQTNALLAKLTSTGTATSATMAKVAASTTATTAALEKAAVATKMVNAEMASIGGGGAGLVSGTIAAKDFAAALEATGGNLGKITPQMLGLAAAEDVVATSSKAAAVSMAELGVAETEAAGLGAGVTREFSVLGAEIARGNFSRIPGSLIVMNERLAATGASVLTLTNFTKAFGALGSVIFNPYVLGFLAVSTGIEVAARAFGGIKGEVEGATAALEAHKKTIDAVTAAYPEAQAAAKRYEDQIKSLPKSVAAADLSKTIVADVSAMNAVLDELEHKLAAPLAAGGRSNFAGVGLEAAREFATFAKELQDGTLNAVQFQDELGKARIDPKLSIAARALASELQEGANQAAELQKKLNEASSVKSVAVDGQKTLADLAAGFKDVGGKAGDANAIISKLFGTLNSGSSDRFGVTRSLGGSIQSTLSGFQQVDQAIQDARQNQLAGMVELDGQFRTTTKHVEDLKNAIATAGGKQNIDAFFGDQANIKGVNDEIARAVTTVNKLFDAMDHGNASVNAVFQGLEMVRATLIQDGLGADAVNKFVDSLIQAHRELNAGTGAAKQLNSAIQAIKDKTVNITVVTKQVGSGTQSSYQVPSQIGGGSSTVNVTRYGADTTGFGTSTAQNGQQFSYRTGMDPATGNKIAYIPPGFAEDDMPDMPGVEFRAKGGPVNANSPYWVGEHGPELVVPSSAGSVIPNAQSMALANPQSAFTGQVATSDANRMWTLQMNIEANTRKTAQLLDEIKTTSFTSSSGLSSGSSRGSISATGYDSNGLNAAGHTAEQVAAFNRVLASAQANYSAIGGMGLVGYGSNGLAATPQQIAYSIVYGGKSPVGFPSGGSSIGSAPTALHGGDPYNAMLNGISPSSPGYAQAYAQALAASNKAKGFATGGIDSSDTQKVEFFKSPNEKVIIARPDQFADVRPGTSSISTSAGGDTRPLQQTNHFHFAAGANVNKDSLAAMRRELAGAVRDGLRSVNGR